MEYPNLLVICAILLLLQFEMGATTATNDGPSRELYASARLIGLDDVGLVELWRTKQPLVISNQDAAGHLTRVTYELSPDSAKITKTIVTERSPPARLEDNSRSKPQEEWEYVPNPVRHYRPVQESSFGAGNFGNTLPSVFDSGFPRSSLFPNWEPPAGVTPRVTTKTEVDNLGQKITTTTRSYSGTLSPGNSVFQQLFPDLSREPGPLPASNPSVEITFSTGSIDSRSGLYPRPSERKPVFVPVVDSTTTQRTLVPLPTLSPERDTVIDDFLEKVGVSTLDIENKNGELTKQIVDRNGRILTLKFVLSSVKGAEENPKQQDPTK
ncbi:uncharacterized protein LOC128262238 isoform X5 [Drosophila gunungcola]|uniref:uncharacterized protein LOC128262238 isoform X5 n=1 Tax=Drosophila gunungcola TaxID=103775 RepID=UPI0022E59DCB|nr:uncharacterized protein LOC128262238 isoform X5 [Drosophila gunungcola]